MRAVLQRVTEASVTVAGTRVGAIEKGLLVLLGVAQSDTEADSRYIAGKIAELRVFEDETGKMNLSVMEVSGSVLVVSQFTLLGDYRKGRRPSWAMAAKPEQAQQLYQTVISLLRAQGIPTETGVFQADMSVQLVNDGPVTLLLDSEKLF